MPVESDLLLTKISVPSQQARNVKRPRLLARFRESAPCKLVTVVAPAGCGKTTFVLEWIAGIPAASRHVAWLSLDSGDNNPARFWSYTIAALKRSCPSFSEELEGLAKGLEPDGDIESLNPLINVLSGMSDTLWLVLDDYHEITQPPVHDGVAYLIEHAPEHFKVLLISRSAIPIPLARLRLRRQLLEFTERDLAFTAEEAGEFLSDVMDLRVSEEDTLALVRTTEGWAAGLQFAALSMKDGLGANSVTGRFAEDGQITEYFTEEVLAHLKPALRDFLLQSSVLGTFSAGMCDAVLGRADGKEMIEELERVRLFLHPVGEGHVWFRYHALFSEALSSMLERDDPQLAAKTHSGACAWLVENGYGEQAVPHALAAGEYMLAAAMLSDYGVKTVGDYRLTELISWVDELPQAAVDQYPQLSVYYALACFELGKFELIEPRLKRIEVALLSDAGQGAITGDADDMRAAVAAIRAAIACVEDEYQTGIDLAQNVMNGKEADNPIVMGVHVDLAYAYETAGNLDAAANAFDRVSQHSFGLGTYIYYVRSRCELARIRRNQGHLKEAEGIYDSLRQYVEQADLGGEWLACAQSGLAELAVERGDLQAARPLVRAVAEFLGQPDFEASSWLHALPAYSRAVSCELALGNVREAAVLAGKLQDALGQCGRLSIQPFGEAVDVLVRVWLATDDLAEAERFLHESRERSFGPGALKTSGRLAIARYYLAVGENAEALELLAQLEPKARTAGAMRLLIEILCLEAVAHDARDSRAESEYALREALRLGREWGFRNLFVAQGEQLRPLLERYARRASATMDSVRAQRHLDAVLKSFDQAFPSPAPEGAVTSGDGAGDFPERCAKLAREYGLSPRQAEVLAMLARGRNAEYLEKALHISKHTAKSHIYSIYRKFGVHSQQMLISIVEHYKL